MAKKDEAATAGETTAGQESTATKSPSKRDKPAENKGTTAMVIPSWDRFRVRTRPGDQVQLYGFTFKVEENGDAVCDVEDYAVEGFIDSGRAILASDHRPAKPLSEEERKAGAKAVGASVGTVIA